jgi:hypothetical protein
VLEGPLWKSPSILSRIQQARDKDPSHRIPTEIEIGLGADGVMKGCGRRASDVAHRQLT